MMNPPASPFRCLAVKHALCGLLLSCLLTGAPGCRSQPLIGQPEAGRRLDVVKLHSGLVISMSVLVAGKKELDEPSKRVSDGNTIILPLLGELDVTDLSLDDLRAQLTERYKHYYVDPQVILDFARNSDAEGVSPWGYVTVMGRVKNPGRIALPATRDLTVSGAIQKANGFATSAKDDAILVSRALPDGITQKRTVNLRSVGEAGRLEEDIVLQAGDVIFVPESRF